jgi:hypothetical protein
MIKEKSTDEVYSAPRKKMKSIKIHGIVDNNSRYFYDLSAFYSSSSPY